MPNSSNIFQTTSYSFTNLIKRRLNWVHSRCEPTLSCGRKKNEREVFPRARLLYFFIYFGAYAPISSSITYISSFSKFCSFTHSAWNL